MTSPRPRPEVMRIAAYNTGDAELLGVNRVIRLYGNEGAFGPPPAALAAYAATAARLHHYPEGDSAGLRRAIAARFELDPHRIVCGTGSDELIGHLCHIYGGPGTELIMSRHGFTMYGIAGTYAGCTIRKAPERDLCADMDAILALVTPATRLVFLANPNNPTGSLVTLAELERLRQGLPPDVLLVLDAAYAEYVERPDYDPGIALVDAGENCVMLRTFSKMFGLGGMRVGWCYAPQPVVDALNRVRGVFNVNIAAQAAAAAALQEPGWVERCRAHNSEWRARMSEALSALGLPVRPSEGNFILVDFGSPERASATENHLRQRGILVRGMKAYELPHCLRITVGTAEECELLTAAIRDFLPTAPANA